MLRLLRSSATVVVILILVLGVLSWLPSLLTDTQHVSTAREMPLFHWVNSWVVSVPHLLEWLGLLFNLTAAVLLMQSGQMYLSDRITYMPAFCYVLLTGAVPQLQFFNAAQVAVILIIFAFRQLMHSFRSEYLSYAYFSAPLCISIASLFFRPAAFLMVTVWLCLLFFRSVYWREWAFSLLGFMLPYFWLFAIQAIFSDSPDKLEYLLEATLSVNPSPIIFASMSIFFIVVLAISMMALVRLPSKLSARKIIIRNGYYELMLIALTMLVMTFLTHDVFPYGWYIMAFPLSFFLSDYFMNVKSTRTGTFVLWVLILAVVLSQLYAYLA